MRSPGAKSQQFTFSTVSEVTNEAVYTMSPTAGPNHHLLSPDASQGKMRPLPAMASQGKSPVPP